jgi:hypothetical protein
MKALDTKRLSSWVPYIVLGLALLTAAIDLPNRVTLVTNSLPVVRLLLQPDEQYRLQLGAVPYDLLRATDAALPRDATVLLVTPGRDIGTLEYITYHRALYFLAPRPVWWAAPTPPDGTWKSRWWLPAPLTPEALRAVATDKGAAYALVFDVSEPLALGPHILERPGGYLVQLEAGLPVPATTITPAHYAAAWWPLGLVLAVAAPMLLGALVVAVARRLGYRAGGVEALSLAWALGAGLLTLLMLYLNAFGVNLSSQMVIGMVVAAIAMLLLARTTLWARGSALGSGTGPRSRPPMDDGLVVQASHTRPPFHLYLARGVQFLLLAVLALQFVLASILAMGRPLDVWDSWVNWGVKSRAIFLEGHIPPAVYAAASRTVTHLDYPLLVPMLQSWFYRWVGAPDDRFAGVASVLFYGALVGICYAAVRGRGGSRLLSLVACATVATISHLAGLASIVFAEMPLAVFATITGVYLLKWLEGGPPGALVLSALGAGLLCWTKRDGVLFLAAVLPTTVLLGWRHRRAWQGAGALALGTLLVSGPWHAFAAANSIPAPDFQSTGLSTLAAKLGRWSTIVELEWHSLTSQSWSYIWPLATLGGLVYWAGNRGRPLPSEHDHTPQRRPAWAALIPVTALLHLVLSGAVYFFSAFVPYEQHILGSIDRLLVQVAPLVVLWVASQALPVSATGENSSKLSNE